MKQRRINIDRHPNFTEHEDKINALRSEIEELLDSPVYILTSKKQKAETRSLHVSDFRFVVQTVSEVFDVPEDTLVSPRRGINSIAEARSVLFFLAYKYIVISYTEIGKLCMRDHSSIIVGSQTIQGKINIYDDLKSKVDLCESKIVEYAQNKN